MKSVNNKHRYLSGVILYNMLIIASINPNHFSEDKIRKIILAGADVLRYNFGYNITEEKIGYIKKIGQIINELHSSSKILIDLPTNKTRLGNFDTMAYQVQEGGEFILKSALSSPDCESFIPVETEKLGEEVYENQTIIIGNGEVSIEVLEIINSETIRVRALNNGVIHPMKSFNIILENHKYLQFLKDKIKKLEGIKYEYIAIPFINKKLNQEIKQLPELKQIKAQIGIKIGNREAIDNLEHICKNGNYDLIIIDRGKLGINMPYEQLGILQKKIVKIAQKEKKQVFISTQILESTINNFVPSRSEIVDLTNMIIDKINGIILCKETAIGNRPVYTIAVAKKIINEVQKNKTYYE